jgi:hypothetical protein
MYYVINPSSGFFSLSVDTTALLVKVVYTSQYNTYVGTQNVVLTGYIDSVTRHEASLTLSINVIGSCAGTESNDYTLTPGAIPRT